MATLSKLYSMREATEHNTRDDCWVVIHGKVRSFCHSFSFFTHIKADGKPSEETAKKGEDKSGLENRNNVSYKQGFPYRAVRPVPTGLAADRYVDRPLPGENCWFSLKLWICHCCSLQVYDVTSYLEEHPGGDDVLLSAAG
ncbi:hypothetical protein B296_00020303, partial [Ensete ventricosum]